MSKGPTNNESFIRQKQTDFMQALSSEKKMKRPGEREEQDDVHLSQLMNVTNDIIKLQSPLNNTVRFNLQQEDNRDVNVEDILNAPSLSISMQTATDASIILEQQNTFQ